jgi:protein subunit release factor B
MVTGMSGSRWQAVAEWMSRLGIGEGELEEEFLRGTGPGGQKINKTSSTVRLRHPATGVEVRCQAGRSLAANRLLARERLCELIEKERAAVALAAQDAREKTRRRRRPRPAILKRRLLEGKRRRAALKRDRRRPETE